MKQISHFWIFLDSNFLRKQQQQQGNLKLRTWSKTSQINLPHDQSENCFLQMFSNQQSKPMLFQVMVNGLDLNNKNFLHSKDICVLYFALYYGDIFVWPIKNYLSLQVKKNKCLSLHFFLGI